MFTSTETDPLIALEHTKGDIVRMLSDSGFRPVCGQYKLPPAVISTIVQIAFGCGRVFGALEGGNHAIRCMEEARHAEPVPSESQHLRAINAEQPQWSDA